ncbi:hypothetical protein FHS95_001765 [Sphingomonas naasensis]|uniref:Uncharacterized protein n=1 Tax=Sphingomonas naasensis TaxID=1344951 RepID=A0A4V3QWX6_9SPHN|nr:hypothetical protein [Sphingomonas naasensis]NIJ20073.1 hypothetical protein [Sphingomonas naasensis]TGX44232.1 hypothetical protein E5A74_05335 [Sphingomonas naasensis]
MSRLLLAAALVAAPVAAHAQDKTKGTTFNGGPLDGIVMGPVVFVSDGKTHFGLKPSKADASPLPATLAAPVAALLKAYDTKDEAALTAMFTADAGAELCPKGMGGDCDPTTLSFAKQFSEHCDHNTPFLMKDGQVRIEWLYKGQLYYISFLDFAGDKVSHVRTLVAEVPPMMNTSNTIVPEAQTTNG